MGIFDKYFIDEEKEKKETVFDKYIAEAKPAINTPIDTQFGVGAKAVGGATLPEPVEIPSSQFGISDLNKPEQMGKIQKGIIGAFGTWEAKKRAMPELQKMEDFANKVVSEAVPLAKSRQGDKFGIMGIETEEIAIIHEYLTGIPRSETLKKMDENWEKYKNRNPDVDERTWSEYFKQEGLWKTLITGPTKGIYDEAEKLQRRLSDIHMKVSEPGRDFIGQVGWTGMVILMGYQGINALYKGGMVVENRIVKGEKLKRAVGRIQDAYIKETDKFKSSLSNNDFRVAQALNNIAKRYGTEPLKGLTKMEVPQEVFMGQAGKITNIVKIIQNAGKLTPEVASQLKALSPAEVSNVIQNLSIASPAIASKLAGELVKLIPQGVAVEPLAEKGEYLYHGTSEGAFRNIREEGITGEKEKYFADTEEYAETYAKRKGSDRILRVKKTPDFVEDRNISEGGDFKTIKNILPENIEIKLGDKWIPIQGYSDIDKNIMPIKPVPKAEVKAEPVKVEPTVDLATPAQIKKAHAIANTKQYISEKGKVKPQYRRLAEAMTGKKSIKDMTPEEAEIFIDSLNRLPEPKYRGGKLVPPSIPRTMKLTTEGFFKKKYGEPTPIWLLTDQTYYAEKLGIKPLVAPFEKGKQTFDLEFRQSSNLVDRMVSKLNKIAKTPGLERIKSTIKNIPTKAEAKMAELLNKHETTPTGLTEKEADVFKYFRNLYKDIWRRENEVREKVDLPAIKYKTAYFRHTADAMAKEMLEGKYPFPEGVKYWSEKMVGKKVFNPMEFQRKLSDDLIEIWSKDIRAVTKAVLWNGLKEIHLAEPSKFLNEQLNAISKDLPEYKNLSPREREAYNQTQVMPASTKKWLVNYVNQVIKGQENELDASLNRIVIKSGLKGIFDKVLSPFGRSVGRKPITKTFSLSGRMVISGVMGWVPRQMIRNAFQQTQNLALYGVKATIKSILPAGIDKNLKGLLSKSLFMKSYTGFEELPVDLMGKLEKAWLYPYGVVANNNAKQGMKAAYWNVLELIKNPKFKKYGWADPQRTKDTPKGKIYPSEKEKLLKEMEFGASCTQYQYIPMGMPGVFRYKALIPLTRLQSWWMNYFTKFNREAIERGFKGRPSWSDKDGPTLPWSRRVNYLKYLVIGGALLTALGYKKSFMLGVAPTYLSPAGQLTLGIYNYATAKSEWQKGKALRQIYYSWKAFIPGSLAWRDFLAVWNGEKEFNEILFYGKKEKKKKIKPAKLESFEKYSPTKKGSAFDKYETKTESVFDKY